MPKKKRSHLKELNDRRSAEAAAAKQVSADQPFVQQLSLLASKAHDNRSAYRHYNRKSEVSAPAAHDRYCGTVLALRDALGKWWLDWLLSVTQATESNDCQQGNIVIRLLSLLEQLQHARCHGHHRAVLPWDAAMLGVTGESEDSLQLLAQSAFGTSIADCSFASFVQLLQRCRAACCPQLHTDNWPKAEQERAVRIFQLWTGMQVSTTHSPRVQSLSLSKSKCQAGVA